MYTISKCHDEFMKFGDWPYESHGNPTADKLVEQIYQPFTGDDVGGPPTVALNGAYDRDCTEIFEQTNSEAQMKPSGALRLFYKTIPGDTDP